MTSKDTTALVEEYIKHYNAGAVEEALALCAPKIQITHHNRGVFIDGKEAFRDVLRNFASLLPDKRFHSRRVRFVDGDNVVVEHTWSAHAEADVPGFAAQGEAIDLDLCTRFTVHDGLIVEHHDYG